MSEIDERDYREMVTQQSDDQIDTWAADLFMDFAKRIGVGRAIAAFCAAAGLDDRGDEIGKTAARVIRPHHRCGF